MEIENIKFAMFEIFTQYKQGKISKEVAEYFVTKLDDFQRKNDVQNLSQVINSFEHGEIAIEFGNNGKPYIAEEEHSKEIRQLFFMQQGEKYPVYLGDIIKLNKNVTKALGYFLERGVYSPPLRTLPWNEPDYQDDRQRFAKLSTKELKKYQNYINELITSRSVMRFGKECLSNIEQKRYEYELIENWQKNMIKNSMAYRIDAYELVSRTGAENGASVDSEKE